MSKKNMSKILEVKEFDRIICNPDFKNEYPYLPTKIFEELKEFIYTYSSDEENDILTYLRPSFMRRIGDIITVKNYVGVIQLKSGFQIQILPKISLSEDVDNSKTKSLFIQMLKCLKEFEGSVFTSSNLKIHKMNLYELFISLYADMVSRLLKIGMMSDYLRFEDNVRFFKGKIKFHDNIKKNLVHKERFYVEYEDYHVNRPENRIIKATLIKLLSISNSMENRKKIKVLLAQMELVKPSNNYIKDFSRVKNDKTVKHYETVINWSKVFLLNNSFSTFSGESRGRALLFPMETVFESYVAKKLKDSNKDKDIKIDVQDKGYYLFDYPAKRFALRPDIVIRSNEKTVILDTKWKRLDINSFNYGITQSDMYQMFAYAKKYETSDVWLLFPQNELFQTEDTITYSSLDNINVHVFGIDLEDVETSMKSLIERISFH